MIFVFIPFLLSGVAALVLDIMDVIHLSYWYIAYLAFLPAILIAAIGAVGYLLGTTAGVTVKAYRAVVK